MAGSALSHAGDVQPVPADREPARGCRTQLQWGRGWENGSLWLWSEARNGDTTAFQLQAKGPAGRILSAPASKLIDATYRPLPCCSQKLSLEPIDIFQGNLDKPPTLWLQSGRGSAGHRFPDGFEAVGWEVEVRIWKKWSSTHSPSHPAAASETTWSLGEKIIKCLLVELPLSASWLHTPWAWKQQHYHRFKGFSGISHFKRWWSCWR